MKVMCLAAMKETRSDSLWDESWVGLLVGVWVVLKGKRKVYLLAGMKA